MTICWRRSLRERGSFLASLTSAEARVNDGPRKRPLSFLGEMFERGPTIGLSSKSTNARLLVSPRSGRNAAVAASLSASRKAVPQPPDARRR